MPACPAGRRCPRLQRLHSRQYRHQNLTYQERNATMTRDGLLSGMDACVETIIIPEKRRPSPVNRKCHGKLIQEIMATVSAFWTRTASTQCNCHIPVSDLRTALPSMRHTS